MVAMKKILMENEKEGVSKKFEGIFYKLYDLFIFFSFRLLL